MSVASAGPGVKDNGGKAKGFDLKNLEAMFAKLTVKDKAVFSRQLSVMFNAGLPLVKAIGVLHAQCENPKLKKALGEIKADIESGVTLAESMAKTPDCFDDLYCAMIQSGEIGGFSTWCSTN
jgi:type IV pilus assembly protein PilC